MYKFGKRSKERLKGVKPELVNVLNELVKIMDVTVIEGLRTKERQEELVASGASKTKYGSRPRRTTKALTKAPSASSSGCRRLVVSTSTCSAVW